MNETWWVGHDQLNDEQQNVVTFPKDSSHLVLGPPGSGKTNLLLLRARFLTLAGHPDLLIIVYTRTLREFIASGAENYKVPPSKIVTCRSWQMRFLGEYGVKVDRSGDYDAQRKAYCKAVAEEIDKRGLNNRYDAILLDEAQDYLPEEIDVFRALTPRLIAVADAKQSIHQTGDAIAHLRSVVDDTVELHFHYRSGHKICVVADALFGENSGTDGLASSCNYDEKANPSSVEYERCEDIDEQANKIVENLRIQRRAYPDEMLAVVCPRNAELEKIWAVIDNSELASVAVLQRSQDHTEFTANTRICVCTIHAVKGLEARVLHIASAEYIKRFASQRRLAFTAVTRAKTSLTIYSSDDLPGFVEGGLAALTPSSDLPDIPDVFGGTSK